MNLESSSVLFTFSTIAQTIATIVIIALTIFTFIIIYLKKKGLKRTSNARKHCFLLFIWLITGASIYVALKFMHPSQEISVIKSFISILIAFSIILSYLVLNYNTFKYVRTALVVSAVILFGITMYIGCYIIFIIFSKMVLIPNLSEEFIWQVITTSRLFVTFLLMSSFYLTGFIVYYKLYLEN